MVIMMEISACSVDARCAFFFKKLSLRADGQPVPCRQSLVHVLNTKAVSTHYPNPCESG